MARIHRMRREMLRRRTYGSVAGDVIEHGDLLVVVAGKVRPASFMTDATGGSAAARLVIVKDKVADAFAGVAMRGKLAGETTDILVAVDVIAEYELNVAVASTIITVGEKLEIDGSDDATTGTAKNQSLQRGTVNPIGKAAREAAIGETTVTVHLVGVDAGGAPVAD